MERYIPILIGLFLSLAFIGKLDKEAIKRKWWITWCCVSIFVTASQGLITAAFHRIDPDRAMIFIIISSLFIICMAVASIDQKKGKP